MRATLALTQLALFGGGSLGSAATLVSIDHPRKDTVHAAGFELTRAGKVTVAAVGIQPLRHGDLTAYAWIIDSRTRRPVWEMDEGSTEAVSGDRLQRRVEETLTLDPGRYELYYYAGSYEWSGREGRDGSNDWNWVEGLTRALHRDGRRSDVEYDVEDHLEGCQVTLSSTELGPQDLQTFDPTGELPAALFVANRMGDSKFVQKGLRLDKPMSVRVYAVLEQVRRAKLPADYGWIQDAATGKRVWEMDVWNTKRAGGSTKNRLCNDEVQLEAGDYLACFGTDDSHSYPVFNQNPPADPLNWGIMLLPGAGFDATAFHTYDPQPRQALVDLTRVGDGQYREQAFRLAKECDLHVRAVGEFGLGRQEFADYGWIADARTGKTIWEMTERNTIHAGGAEKNRMFESVVHLPAGEYVAAYVSDDSHSYRKWNAGAPFQPESWGLAVLPGPQMAPGDLKPIDASEMRKSADVLVELVRVGSSQDRRQRFVLDKPTRVAVYALGESAHGDMADYGWIVDERSGKTVWEMTDDDTRPAGGALKNRMAQDEILLPAGTYVAHYVTDDSHAFGDWNAERPRDPMAWGITLRVVGE